MPVPTILDVISPAERAHFYRHESIGRLRASLRQLDVIASLHPPGYNPAEAERLREEIEARRRPK